MKGNEEKLTLSFIAIVYLAAWFFQTKLLVNADVSWLMEASRRLLAGGNYSTSFFEINPPMILYLYFPAVLLSKVFALPADLALRVYVFALATVSLLICTRISNTIIPTRDRLISGLLLIAIATVYLILPVNDFGQREHFLIILTLPYFLLVASRLHGISYHSSLLPAGIGLMAGFGFAMKPHFLIALLLIELFHFYKKRNWQSLNRPEFYTVLAVLICYGIAILTFHQDYLTIILPLITHYYYQQYHTSLSTILFGDQSLYFYTAIVFYCVCKKTNSYADLTSVFLIAGIGFYVSYVAQLNVWHYHFLPVLSMAVILMALLFSILITNKNLSTVNIMNVVIFSLIMLAYILTRLNYALLSAAYNPVLFFVFFVTLFSLLLYIAHEKTELIVIASSILLLGSVNLIFYNYLSITTLQSHLFSLSIVMLFLFYILLIPNKVSHAKAKFTFFAAIGTLAFAYPACHSGYIYTAALDYTQKYGVFVDVLRSYPGKSMAFFTDSGEFTFPGLALSANPLASRFSGFAGLPIIVDSNDPAAYQIAYAKDKANIDFYINAITDDFNHMQPELVFVDVRSTDKVKKLGYYGNTQLDYLKLFQQNPRFTKAFASYRYLETVDGQPLFKFAIYQRHFPRQVNLNNFHHS